MLRSNPNGTLIPASDADFGSHEMDSVYLGNGEMSEEAIEPIMGCDRGVDGKYGCNRSTLENVGDKDDEEIEVLLQVFDISRHLRLCFCDRLSMCMCMFVCPGSSVRL